LNLLKDLQEEFGLTYLFIAHDLAVVDFFCDVMAVMYMGRIVELLTPGTAGGKPCPQGRANQRRSASVCRNPLHPYTRALISAIPRIGVSANCRLPIADCQLPIQKSQIENRKSKIPVGCTFGPKCSLAGPDCLRQPPPLAESSDRKGHFVACWKC